jgi:hypothetical protein
MTSQKQFEANRQNAQKSTGPQTDHGKRRSRRNAFRHGLTAETVVGGIEDARDYKAFQAALISDYAPHSAAEHELVLRLASLLWRLRRATAIETGLFDIQAGILNGSNSSGVEASKPISDLYRVLGLEAPTAPHRGAPQACSPTRAPNRCAGDSRARKKDPRNIAQCYLSLANLPNEIFERIGYYEARLWRQTLQTLVTLEAMRGSYPKFKPKVMSDAGAHRNIFGERASTRLW